MQMVTVSSVLAFALLVWVSASIFIIKLKLVTVGVVILCRQCTEQELWTSTTFWWWKPLQISEKRLLLMMVWWIGLKGPPVETTEPGGGHGGCRHVEVEIESSTAVGSCRRYQMVGNEGKLLMRLMMMMMMVERVRVCLDREVGLTRPENQTGAEILHRSRRWRRSHPLPVSVNRIRTGI